MRKNLRIAAVVGVLAGAALACSRADVPFEAAQGASQQTESAVAVAYSSPASPTPTPFQPAEPVPAAEISVTAPTDVPTEVPTAAPTEAPAETETPLPDIVLAWQALCSSPAQCGSLLLDGGWQVHENDRALYGVWDFPAGPALSLARNAGDCEDAAMALAAGLLDDGYTPYVLLLATDRNGSPNNHAVYAFREDGLWGYVSMTLRDSAARNIGAHVEAEDARFPSLEALFSFYQESHPWKEPYTRYFLVDLASVPDWLASQEAIEFRIPLADNIPESDVLEEPPAP